MEPSAAASCAHRQFRSYRIIELCDGGTVRRVASTAPFPPENPAEDRLPEGFDIRGRQLPCVDGDGVETLVGQAACTSALCQLEPSFIAYGYSSCPEIKLAIVRPQCPYRHSEQPARLPAVPTSRSHVAGQQGLGHRGEIAADPAAWSRQRILKISPDWPWKEAFLLAAAARDAHARLTSTIRHYHREGGRPGAVGAGARPGRAGTRRLRTRRQQPDTTAETRHRHNQ